MIIFWKLREGNVFSHACLFTGRGEGVDLPASISGCMIEVGFPACTTADRGLDSQLASLPPKGSTFRKVCHQGVCIWGVGIQGGSASGKGGGILYHTIGYGRQAGSTHLTGMHSSSLSKLEF